MKRPTKFLSAAFFTFICCLSLLACSSGGGDSSKTDSQSQNNNVPLRIMPLGDSITSAESGHSSYRYWLWLLLLAQGFNIDFVGGEHGVFMGVPLNGDFDQDHEGHWRWRADQILSIIDDRAAVYQPDIVLLHLGTNDIFQNNSIPGAIDELGQIIDTLRAHNPFVVIFLAQLIPNNRRPADTEFFNSLIPGLAAAKTSADSPVIVVNHSSGFNVEQDLYDGIHPNDSGEQKMAGVWFNHIVEQMLN